MSLFDKEKGQPRCPYLCKQTKPQEFPTLQGDVYSLVVFNQEYDPHIDQHQFPQNFSKWNRRPKGSSNFGSVGVHLFVDAHDRHVHTHGSPKEFPTLHGDVYSLVVLNQEYDPHIDRHRFPQNF
jgi:hypothetical protein